jgi:uncharacterized iron-regulated membrane protein
MKLRQLAFTLHRYVGVTVGLLLVLIGLTGSLLVFDNETESFLNPELLRVTPQGERLSIESILSTARKTYPELKLEHISVPQEPNEVYTITTSHDYISIYVNPYTGSVLGSRLWRQSYKGFLYDLHVSLFACETGVIVVAMGGLLLVLLSATGVILWPGWRRLVSGLKIRWRSPWRLVNYDLHKVAGILSVVFLVLIASTGVAMSFWTQSEQALYWLTHTPKLAESIDVPASDKPPLMLDELLTKADASLPSAKTILVDLPSTPQKALRVRKKLPQETDPYGWSFVYLDQYSGSVLRVDNALKATLAGQINNSLYTLHIGAFGGLKMRILYMFIGLVPTVLTLTGLAIWWSRTYNRKRIKQS